MTSLQLTWEFVFQGKVHINQILEFELDFTIMYVTKHLRQAGKDTFDRILMIRTRQIGCRAVRVSPRKDFQHRKLPSVSSKVLHWNSPTLDTRDHFCSMTRWTQNRPKRVQSAFSSWFLNRIVNVKFLLSRVFCLGVSMHWLSLTSSLTRSSLVSMSPGVLTESPGQLWIGVRLDWVCSDGMPADQLLLSKCESWSMKSFSKRMGKVSWWIISNQRQGAGPCSWEWSNRRLWDLFEGNNPVFQPETLPQEGNKLLPNKNRAPLMSTIIRSLLFSVPPWIEYILQNLVTMADISSVTEIDPRSQLNWHSNLSQNFKSDRL